MKEDFSPLEVADKILHEIPESRRI
jgi:hypothetical protein